MTRIGTVAVWLALSALSLAQLGTGALPVVALSSFNLTTEEDLVVNASGLEPQAEYRLEATGPGERLSETLSADAEGAFAYALRLAEPGSWQVAVAGPGLEGVRFRVRVEAAAPSAESGDEAAPSGVSPPEAGQTEPGSSAPETEEPAATQTEDETGEQQTPTEEGAAAPLPSDPEGEAQDETDAEPDSLRPGAEDEAAQSPNPRPDDFSLEGDSVVARVGEAEAWRLEFPANSGATGAILVSDDVLYLGHGNSLLAVSPTSGEVEERWLLPGQVTGLEEDGASILVSAAVAEGLSERFTLENGELQETVRFGGDPEVYGWLRQEAEVSDPEARLERDPTNPWLHFAAGQTLEEQPLEAERRYGAAVEAGQTFYDLANLARELAERGRYDLAERALDRSLQDFAARGYDPRLLGGYYRDLYGFPLEPFELSLAAGDEEAADFWAGWLRYFATPETPEVRGALLAYAEALQRAGERDEAARVRDSLGVTRTVSANALETTALSLGRSGWYAALALVLAFFALHLVLAVKYLKAQRINLERRRLLSKPVRPLSGLMLMRYYSFTEKLVLLLLLVGSLLSAALAAWVDRGQPSALNTDALASGTFANAAARSVLDERDWRGPQGAFIEGYAAQVVGDLETARTRYETLSESPAALNNLGALTGDEAFYRRALELSPGFSEARYNLGETGAGFAFQQDYRPGEPLLAAPSERELQLATAGSWDAAVGEVFRNPWTGLLNTRPASFSPLAWGLVVVLFLLLVVLTLAWLFAPRMRWIRQAPRSSLYHLLALLAPGSGLADEMWGLLLIAPWALVGFDALAKSLGWPFLASGLSLTWDLIILAAVYLINTVAVAVEYLSYRRRLQALKRDNPSLAQEFGLTR